MWPVVWAAVELLTSDHLDRVREREDERGCGYLFIDTNKNRSRRWCSMDSCGI
jgi:predicted RNA-binding Zn ribbon-like protein